MISYLIDYDTPSSSIEGTKSQGSLYIRGVKGPNGDSFKFVMEKNVDFHALDVQILLNAYETAFESKQNSAYRNGS